MDGLVDSGFWCPVALVCVESVGPETHEYACKLAKTWGVPMAGEYTGNTGVKVIISDGNALGLGFIEAKRGLPFYVDFMSQTWRSRFRSGLPSGHILKRAIGYKGKPLRVLDATAGFGQDSMLAVVMGCEVIAVEKSPVVAAVLQDGLRRALQEDASLKEKLARLKVVSADSLAYLKSAPRMDVVYLDPMFDKPKKKAKSPKEMQLLQELLGPPPTAEEHKELFSLAFERALGRVVVKRPLKAIVGGPTPTHSFKGQSIRYDIYVKT